MAMLYPILLGLPIYFSNLLHLLGQCRLDFFRIFDLVPNRSGNFHGPAYQSVSQCFVMGGHRQRTELTESYGNR